jgi:hypothetical protein
MEDAPLHHCGPPGHRRCPFIAATNPPLVRLPLAQRGWHAVYLGLATTSGGFNIGGNGLRAKLSDEPVYRRLANNLALLPNRRAVIQECFLTVAELTGQSIQIAPLSGLPATLCYVKVVPLTAAEVESARAKSKHRTSIATFDGHSWIWPFKPTTAEELAEEFRGLEETDIGKWWFQVTGADLVCYPSKVGTYPGEGTTDFPTGGVCQLHAVTGDALQEGHQSAQGRTRCGQGPRRGVPRHAASRWLGRIDAL